MPPGDHSRSRSSPEIPATSYQLLYEFERRLDDKMREARDQTKEDIKTAVTLAVAPIFPRLDHIDRRLNEGNARFDAQDERSKQHEGLIAQALASADAHKTNCPVQRKKAEPETTQITRKGKPMPWWLPLLLGGALAFIGEKAARFVINGLADPPSASNAPAVLTPQAQPSGGASTNSGGIHINMGQQKQ